MGTFYLGITYGYGGIWNGKGVLLIIGVGVWSAGGWSVGWLVDGWVL